MCYATHILVKLAGDNRTPTVIGAPPHTTSFAEHRVPPDSDDGKEPIAELRQAFLAFIS